MPPSPTSKPRSQSVLIVDDDTELRTCLRVGLQKAGMTVDEAEDGDLALEMLEAKSFDWVITDIVMPNQDGIQLIRKLRQARPTIRIVAISGGGIGAADNYLRMARLLGANHVLEKPFGYKELVQLMLT
jgi:DNA-binding response OmpR family regulator